MFRHRATYLERLRRPIHVLQCLHKASSTGQGVPRTKDKSVAPRSVGYADGLPTSVNTTTEHWGSGNPAFAISFRACRRTGLVARPQRTRLLLDLAFQPGCCPLALSGLGQAVASESFALNSGPLRGQFTPCVTRRTLSIHTAPQSSTTRRAGGLRLPPRGGYCTKASPKGDNKNNSSRANYFESITEEAERFGTNTEMLSVVSSV